MSKKPTKASCQKIHAKKRAAERFGIDFTKEVRKYFLACIHGRVKSDIVLWKRQSNRTVQYLMTYEGKVVYFAFDRERQNIVTFLFPSEDAINFMKERNNESNSIQTN